MQASETKLEQIIEGTKQYVVPLFQRPYSWKKTQWESLWNDLVELCEADNPRPHFMGSIVTMPTTAIPEGISKYLLIDGQQRLTTIFILLSALRDIAKTSDEELAEEINNTILVNPFKKGLDYYKLQPTQSDRGVFHEIIRLENPVGESDVSNCYSFFKKKIVQSNLQLQRIKKIICRNLSLVSVVLSHDDDPYLVFEGLNAKGRPLTQADLIRNYFFMRIHADEQESVYEKYWEPMQKLLGDNLTEFIRHYLTKAGIVVNQSDIYFQIKDRIGTSDALSYLKDLCVFSKYYAKLLDPNKEPEEDVSKYLNRLNRLELAIVHPFLLNCYEDWQQNHINKQEFINIIQILENFLLRRFVCNVQTQGLNRFFASLYLQISKNIEVNSNNFIDKLKVALQNQKYPKDADFRARLVDVELYGGNRSGKCKLILESIEEFYKHRERVSFSELSIEHVMPQTLTDDWKVRLGEDWAITHELLLHTLGNVTLTGYNADLSNKSFESKKRRLKESNLELNKYFDSKDSWIKEDIEERAAILADISLQIWSYFGE